MPTIELELYEDGARDELSLSGVAAAGPEHVFVAPDEGGSILRLQRTAAGYRRSGRFALAELTALPGEPGDEIDLEGMDLVDGRLWLVGSHSAVRTRIRRSTPDAEVGELLATVTTPASRRLLVSIPIADDVAGPTPVSGAACLGGGGLHTALRDDPHIGPFLGIPGKDNGLDIEGVAVVGSRVLLGLRGPVLRGWAVVLEIAPRESAAAPGQLVLTPLRAGPAPLVVPHFLDLGGLGIRDLARAGDDLLVLAGPTMVLDGPTRVVRVRHAGTGPLPEVVRRDDLDVVVEDLPFDIPAGDREPGADHAEGMTVVTRSGVAHLLVVYDSPSDPRTTRSSSVAELIPLP